MGEGNLDRDTIVMTVVGMSGHRCRFYENGYGMTSREINGRLVDRIDTDVTTRDGRMMVVYE